MINCTTNDEREKRKMVKSAGLTQKEFDSFSDVTQGQEQCRQILLYFVMYKNHISSAAVESFNKNFNANLSVAILNFLIDEGVYDSFAEHMEEDAKRQFSTGYITNRDYLESLISKAKMTKKVVRTIPLFRLKQRKQREKKLVYSRVMRNISTNRPNRARTYRSPARNATTSHDDGGGGGGGDPDSSDPPAKHLSQFNSKVKQSHSFSVSVILSRLLSHGFSGREAA